MRPYVLTAILAMLLAGVAFTQAEEGKCAKEGAACGKCDKPCDKGEAPTSQPTDKPCPGKCGEGKCGEGKCGNAEKTSDASPVNKTCPVMGGDVDPEVTCVHDGKVIGFCCKSCLAKFTNDPAKYLPALN